MKRGRPSRFVPSVIVEVLLAVRRGNDLGAAARRAGVSASTVRRWLDDGRAAASPELVDFAECVEAAAAGRWILGTGERAKKRARALVEEVLAEALARVRPEVREELLGEVERVMRERGLDVIPWRLPRSW